MSAGAATSTATVTETAAPLTCWLLTDGAAGHESQSRGIADAIARFRPVNVVVVPLRIRRRLLKSLGRVLLRLGNTQWLLDAVHDIELPAGRPDFILSSGGNTLLANALLARRHGVPNFYSGTPKGFDNDWYSCIFTVTEQGGGSNVVLPLPPVPGNLCAPMPAPAADAPLALLVGGNGGLPFADADWHALAQQANAVAAESGRRWLVTTSRRTGAEAENILAHGISSTAIEDAVWWARAPRKVVRDFLSRAGAVYVTGDSMTMIAEAIYAGRPVHVLMPAQGAHDAQDAEALAGYVRAGLVRVVPIAEMARDTPFFVAPPVPDVQALIWQSVRECLP